MPSFRYLDEKDILQIHREILKLSDELEKDGLITPSNLKNAIESSKIEFGGFDIYPDPISKVGTMMFEMITLHPFIEGNKRTGLICADTLMVLNYGVIIATDRQRKYVTWEIAKGNMSRENVIRWLRNNHVHHPSLKIRKEISLRLTEEREGLAMNRKKC